MIKLFKTNDSAITVVSINLHKYKFNVQKRYRLVKWW